MGTLLGLTLVLPAAAGDDEVWQSIFQNIPKDSRIVEETAQEGKLYGANATFTIRDGNGKLGDFGDNDLIFLDIQGNGVSLSFGSASDRKTKQELVDWAEANKTQLFRAIFGDSPERSASGMTTTQSLAQSAFISSVYMAPNALPGTTGTAGPGTTGVSEAETFSFVPVSNKDIVISGQHDSMKIGADKATGSSGIMAYEWRFGASRTHSAGISIPYRQLDLEDNLDTEYKHAAFMPFFKKRWYQPNGVVEWMVNGTLGVTYLKSKVFTDGGGYMEYGGGTGIRYSHALSSNAIVNAGLMYQALKKEIPNDLVPEEVRWISNALNALPWEHSIIPSVGGIMNFMDGFLTLRGEVFRVHQVQDDVPSGYENQTVVFGMATIRPLSWFSFSLGYKESFELEDVTDQSYVVDFTLTW